MTDWRLPENRRRAFLYFYWFHLRYRAHPGAVYYVLPALAEGLALTTPADRLWLAFVNGHTQNPVTSWIIVRTFPDPFRLDGLADWFAREHKRLAFDTDRRHHKQAFPSAVLAAAETACDPSWWAQATAHGWGSAWAAGSSLPTFGRLSTWSYLEYVRILGWPVECDTLMLDDRAGSRSHRNGLCLVAGLDAYDWHASNPRFDGRYSPALLHELAGCGARLLADAREQAPADVPAADIGYLTLESALCTYKSWHRPNRRYPNVYNDMFHDRIRTAESAWPELDFLPFWRARALNLPDGLRLELNPDDPGVSPLKQNWYRETGQIPMLGHDWPDLFPCDMPTGDAVRWPATDRERTGIDATRVPDR